MGAKRPKRVRVPPAVATGDADADPPKRPSSGLGASEFGVPDHVTCPFCNADDTELHSPFGSALSVATYWCNRCRTAFEWVKWAKD